MKSKILSLLLVVILLLMSTAPVFAGGGKVRGESGQGSVTQVQVQDPPPFQP